MVKKELIQIINKQIDTNLTEDISRNELQQKLIVFINDLIQNNFQRLVAILYKVDVDENKLKRILKEDAGKDAADIIARLIIEREIQKTPPIETRTIQRPSRIAGVTYAAPDRLSRSAQRCVCASSASPSTPGGSWRTQTVCSVTGASTFQPRSAPTCDSNQRAFSMSRRRRA